MKTLTTRSVWLRNWVMFSDKRRCCCVFKMFFFFWAPQVKCHLVPLYSREDRHVRPICSKLGNSINIIDFGVNCPFKIKFWEIQMEGARCTNVQQESDLIIESFSSCPITKCDWWDRPWLPIMPHRGNGSRLVLNKQTVSQKWFCYMGI